MESLSINWLHDEIQRRELPLADSVYEFLNRDLDRARESFIRIIKASIREYDKHYPVVMRKSMIKRLGLTYTFRDNFEVYLAGNITEAEIELIPEAIAKLRAGWANNMTHNNWRYLKPTLHANGGINTCVYFAYHPLRYELSPDGNFTEDSKIYYMNQDADTFINLVSFNVLNFLSTTRNTLIQPTGLQFFDFSRRLEELRTSIDLDFSTAPALYAAW